MLYFLIFTLPCKYRFKEKTTENYKQDYDF